MGTEAVETREPDPQGTSLAGGPPREATGTATAVRWIAIAALCVGLYYLMRPLGRYVPEVVLWIEQQGAWGPALFVLAYAAAAVAFVPGALLTLAGGALFDIFPGVFYVFAAAVLGSSAAFLIARYVAREAVARRIGQNPRFAAVDRAVGREGLKIVFLLRLSPVFPFSFMNYALGLTGVTFRDYLIASLGMIPGTFLYVYYGKLAGDVAALAGGATTEDGTGRWVLLGIGAIATLAVTTFVTRLASRALREATEGAGSD